MLWVFVQGTIVYLGLAYMKLSVPDKRWVSGQKRDKAGNMTQLNKWST